MQNKTRSERNVKMRKLTALGAKLFLLLYCTRLFVVCQASTKPEHPEHPELPEHGSSESESELDSDYHDYILDDVETSRTAEGCEEGMFQCADK